MGDVKEDRPRSSDSMSELEMSWMASDVGLAEDEYIEPVRWWQRRGVVLAAHSVSVICALGLIAMAVAVWRADEPPAKLPELAALRVVAPAPPPPLPPPPVVAMAAPEPVIEMAPEPVAKPVVRKAKRSARPKATKSPSVSRPLPALPKPPPAKKRRFGHF
jgi:hypothetical protein